MSKRGLRGTSLDQLEKNLAEAFAILDTMGVSTNVINCICTLNLQYLHSITILTTILQIKRGMSKRGLRGASLDELEKNLAEAFAILDTMGISNSVRNSLLCFDLYSHRLL